MHHLDFSSRSWEDFEDICVHLWFDEGYRNIKPMGRRKEGGRDAIFIDSETGKLTIFQFKCWVEKYEPSKLRILIKEAAYKVKQFSPDLFILNSAQKPHAGIIDWIPSLSEEIGFQVDYYDRSWVDLRLDDKRQDLRKHYFGLSLAHHTWESLIAACGKQVDRTIQSLSPKFAEEVYVSREVEKSFFKFVRSNKLAMAIVDSSGSGKTNLLCSLANQLRSRRQPVILLSSFISLVDDHGLERIVCDALGYDVHDYQSHLQNVSRILQEHEEIFVILIDSLSETESASKVNRSLKNLLSFLDELGRFKLCITCRDASWPQISYGLPIIKSYEDTREETSTVQIIEYRIGNFSDDELDRVIPLYKEKYNVQFKPLLEARNQLKHPLLLRFFCETNKDSSIGDISSIPIALMFQHYLKEKTQSVSYLLEGKYNHKTIHKILLNVAGNMWLSKDTKFLTEEMLNDCLPVNMSLSEKEEVIHALLDEGIFRVSEDPISLEGIFHFVFDTLREYLQLQFLLTKVPESIRQVTDISTNPTILLERYSPGSDSIDIIKLLSLIGMIQPEVYKRRKFLQALLKWDFQTFSSCLSYIPPVGKLQKCNVHQIRAWAQELCRWYVEIIGTMVDEIHLDLDPWRNRKSGSERVGMKVHVSPDCKEISYSYYLHDQVNDPESLVIVKETKGYPTWHVSLVSATKRLELHDPDRGFMIPVFPNNPEGLTTRTINFKFYPNYAGESFNIPERRVLFDILYEVNSYIENFIFPRSRQIENSGISSDGESGMQWLEMTDEDLSSYLIDVFANAQYRYNQTIKKYFPKLGSVLNLFAQYPCNFLFVTDRASLRYAFVPVDSEEKIKPSYAITDIKKMEIANPGLKILVREQEQEDEFLHEQFVIQELKKLERNRPPIHPIDRIEPISMFFGSDPINELAKEWLLADLRELFGF